MRVVGPISGAVGDGKSVTMRKGVVRGHTRACMLVVR